MDTVFGSAFHNTIQLYLKILYEQTAVQADQEFDIIQYFKEQLLTEYKQSVEKNNGIHFSTKEQINEYYNDGVEILTYFKKHRASYFSKRNTSLVGIEIPLTTTILPEYPNTLLSGFIDIVFKNETEDHDDTYTIIDFKTSNRGWKDKAKRDPDKIQQILLYKKYYSRILGIPEDKIEVLFLIFKRKVFSSPDFPYPISRVQELKPASGRLKMKKITEEFEEFIRSNYNSDGSWKEREYTKNIENCKYCPYLSHPELCDRNQTNSENNPFF